jgi:outer membrane protein OmpA-like peptidoglycan-associated protein
MPSVIALRALLGAGLGLGALDVVWINVGLAPQLIAPEPARVQVVEETPTPTPVVEPIVTPTPPPPPVTPIEEPPAPQVTSVYFETGSSELTAASRQALADLVAAGPKGEIVAEGHADARGPERLNEALSKDRAMAVQQALIRLGVSGTRIQVKFAGAAESSSELWRDRRVDIQVVGGTR